jgi:predicted metal-binding membrane protein
LAVFAIRWTLMIVAMMLPGTLLLGGIMTAERSLDRGQLLTRPLGLAWNLGSFLVIRPRQTGI